MKLSILLLNFPFDFESFHFELLSMKIQSELFAHLANKEDLLILILFSSFFMGWTDLKDMLAL